MGNIFTHPLAERADEKKVMDDFNAFTAINGISKVLDELPQVTALLNKERQVVFSNKALNETLGKEQLDEILGMRFGEIINCRNAKNTTGGCGTSEQCTVCGALGAILESQKYSHKVTKECRIITAGGVPESSLDLNVTASPFHFNNSQFTLLSIVDDSHQKRRQVFERIFFHDIMNTVTALKWNLEYLPLAKDKSDSEKVIKAVNAIGEDLMEEILTQRDLASAEAGDLVPHLTSIRSKEILLHVKSKLQHNSITNNKLIIFDEISVDVEIETDAILLKRVLTNMLKNALEGTPDGGLVFIGAQVQQGWVTFTIQNPKIMPKDVQYQVFQRSFSTKGHNRGLGTYSMKLITEKYLGGKIGFVSNETEGTKFFIKLPV